MSAHLYWRLNISATDTGSTLTLAEIGLRSSVGGANLAGAYTPPTTISTGGTAAVDAASYTGNAASLFDGNATTGWLTNGVNHTVRYTFASSVDLRAYQIVAWNAGGDWSNYAPKSWTLERSTDGGATWAIADTRTNVPDWAMGEARVFNLPSAGAATDWRLNITHTRTDSYTGFVELEMYSSEYLAPWIASSGTPISAFDANNATAWAVSSGTTGWIGYNFTTPVGIVEHSVTAPAGSMTNAPKNWTLQWSDDGFNWTSAAIVNGQTGWSSNEQRVFTSSDWPTAIGVGVLRPQFTAINTQTPPVASVKPLTAPPAALQTSTTITGTVTQGGVPCARTVRAYRRIDGMILGETVSHPTSGAFTINARGTAGNCYVVALDDLTLSPDFNAVIFDLVIPA